MFIQVLSSLWSKWGKLSPSVTSETIKEQVQGESAPRRGKLAKKPDVAAASALFLPHFGIWVLQ